MATADGLIDSGIMVIEVASTDEALSYLECRNGRHPDMTTPLTLARTDLSRSFALSISSEAAPMRPRRSRRCEFSDAVRGEDRSPMA